MGASVVNALSEWLEVQVHKDGKIYEMKFARGEVVQEALLWLSQETYSRMPPS